MFCTLEDAWGCSKITDTNTQEMFKQSDKSQSFQEKEMFTQETTKETTKDQMYNQYIQLKEMFDNDQHNASQVCLAVDNHFSKCSYCKNKYLSANLSQESLINKIDLSKINHYILTNKDTITIVLIILLILLLLQLFFKK